MPKISEVAYYATHPSELRSMLQWKMWHEPIHERDPSKESPELKQCFHYLVMTSRSFAAVIMELHPELLVPVCLFYLVLRGLDTIEDDMTISIEEKEPLLRNFEHVLEKDGWTYTGNGPDEKDRALLVEFNVVVAEFKKIKPEYREIIKDITRRMGNGMADYANNRDHNLHGVNTIKDYELYCHYVAGLVGEGLTRLFVEAKLANPALLKRSDLHESMGQFLQQTNIIRDIREDHDDKRYFWPREVWSKHVDKFEQLFEPANREKALNCSSEMILISLRRAEDCLFYLAGIRDQSVFNFCAIPQSMAIATLELCFRNPAMFDRNIKITKGQACNLMTKSTQNLQIVCDVFRTFARRIHQKNTPTDPNFLDISIACGRIEVFIESIFPSQTATMVTEERESGFTEKDLARRRLSKEDQIKLRQVEAEQNRDNWIILAAVVGVMLAIGGLMVLVAALLGGRFDLAWEGIKNGNFLPKGSAAPTASQIKHAAEQALDKARDEL